MKAAVSGVLEDLKLKFQKARTKIEVVLTLPGWLSQQSKKACIPPNVCTFNKEYDFTLPTMKPTFEYKNFHDWTGSLKKSCDFEWTTSI